MVVSTGTIFKTSQVLEFASLGSYVEYDLFGIEVSHYAMTDTDMPSDAQRIQYIKRLVEDGREDKVVIAQDIHTKHRLVSDCSHTKHRLVSECSHTKHRLVSECNHTKHRLVSE